MHELFATLAARKRPEDVAEIILANLGPLLPKTSRAALEKAACHSLKRTIAGWTSMAERFHTTVPPERQVAKALELFRLSETWAPADFTDAEKISALVARLSPLIRRQLGQTNFKQDRLNSAQREQAGLDISRRRYNKLFRMLQRLERKLSRYVREQRKELFTKIGKTRLAASLSLEEFSKDSTTAAFVSYFVARCGLRSTFTNEKQVRPYDEIADALFKALSESPTTNWWAIAHVMPDSRVLNHLTDSQRGNLLGRWLTLLHDIAALLKETWTSSDINRASMIVRRGNDSSTWNNTASAWNKAREAWIALMHELGFQSELDQFCPGKVLRLMAGDVAAWHLASGGKLEPDTLVWNELPLPWEVLAGTQSCTRERIQAVCEKHGVDPVKKGWIAPPPERRVANFTPTPELVHGVSIGSPQLALTLKKAGWFSGRWSTSVIPVSSVKVLRDNQGFVTGATEI